jgi:hypothetical protein
VRKEFSKVKAPTTFTREEDGPDDSILAGEAEDETPTRPSNHELHLLKLLFIHEELAPWLAAHLDVNWLAHPLVRQIVESRLVAAEQGTWQNLAAFLDGCDSEFMRGLLTEAVADDRALPNPQTQLADVTLKLRNQFLDQQIFSFTQRAVQLETSDAEKNEALVAREKLRTQKRSPLAPLEK